MLRKCLICTIFLAFVTFVLANDTSLRPPRPTQQNATKCYTCNTPVTCRSPTTVLCNQKSANNTRSILTKHFLNVANITNTTTFECMKIRYTFNKTVALAVSGCMFAGLNPCKLHPKNVSYTTDICKNCTNYLCNPANTFSSSMAPIMSSIFCVLLLKLLSF